MSEVINIFEPDFGGIFTEDDEVQIRIRTCGHGCCKEEHPLTPERLEAAIKELKDLVTALENLRPKLNVG